MNDGRRGRDPEADEQLAATSTGSSSRSTHSELSLSLSLSLSIDEKRPVALATGQPDGLLRVGAATRSPSAARSVVLWGREQQSRPRRAACETDAPLSNQAATTACGLQCWKFVIAQVMA